MHMNDAAPAATKPKDDPTIWRVDDALWAEIQPLLVVDKPRKKPGRPRRDDRPIFDGLIWLARTGSQWAALPRTFGAKSTVHARFLAWVEQGCFQRAWAVLLARYDGAIGLDWQWQAADGCLVKAPLGKKGALGRRKRRGRTPPTGEMRRQAALADRRQGRAPRHRPLRGQPHRHEETG
jgi:transposase